MSRIAGIFNLDGSRANRELLSRMAAAIGGPGSDGQKIYQNGPVGLIHNHFWTTPEELGEEQPISDTDERYWITADARLDNRGELIHLLEKHIDNINGKVPSDAELILASYKRWKEKSPRYLIGDFAFALWDSQEQLLFCARDPAGVRLLNYSRFENTLFFASNIRSIIAGQNAVPQINKQFIRDLLAFRYDRWIYETAYHGIFRLPQAYQMTTTAKGPDLNRYWIFGLERFHLNTEQEYILKFLEIFKEAISARTRSIGPIGVSVSGGVDSSSICCTLNDLISSGMIHSDVQLYSLVYDHTPSLDEKDFLESVERRCPSLKANRILADDLWGLHKFGNEDGYFLEDPEIMSGRGSALAIAHRAALDGCRVLLSGLFGDEVLGAPYSYSLQVLKDIKLRSLPEELLYFSSPELPVWQLLAYGYLTPHIPSKMKTMIKTILSRRISKNDEMPFFLSQLCDPAEICYDLLPSPELGSRISELICNTMNCGLTSEICINTFNRGAHAGIEYASPFLDRRLIDFLISVPPALLFKKGFDKYILRQAMKGILPEKVRMRKDKAFKILIPAEELKMEEKRKIDDLMEKTEAVSSGFVEKAKLDEAYRLYLEGRYPSNLIDRFLCTESWLRSYNKDL